MNNNTEIPDFSGIKRILIIRLSSLGDILLSTPLIRTLKNQYPGLIISFVLRKQYEDSLRLNPHISELFLYEPQKEKLSNLVNELRKQKFDLILDLQNNFRSRELISSLKIKTAKFSKRSLDKFLLVNFKINRLEKAPPIPERYTLTIPGIKLDDGGLELFTQIKPSSSLAGKEKLIGIAPGSKHFTKMWPADYYEFLGKLLEKAGYTVVLFGGNSDAPICRKISENLNNPLNLCNDNNLLQTAADMKKCLAVVCNDSGLMHVACAMNVPVLAFFGSTVKEFGFAPYKNRNLILENKSLTCRPCSHIGRDKCPKRHFRCMLELLPEKAFEVLMTLIEN